MKTVCILMSTYNGEHFIREQIDSLLEQKGVQIKILIRDDGSSDGTMEIIQEYASQNENISVISDDNVGPAKSFMLLLKAAPKSDYYSFCDQDDYWENNKLISAVQKIEKAEGAQAKIPVMYHSNLKLVDQDLNLIKMAHSQDFSKECRYSSLVENSVTGCTIVINHALARILNRKMPDDLTMHDAWCNIVCSFFGRKIYDKNAYIQYRQHSHNAIGMGEISVSEDLRSKFRRIHNTDLQPRLLNATQFYQCYKDNLSPKYRKKIEKMVYYKSSIINRLKLLFDFDIRSYNLKTDLKYRLLILLGEI